MSATALALPDDKPIFYDTTSAARFLSLSVKTLERHRLQGTGPVYQKAGPGRNAKVLYTKQALTDWLAKFTYQSTSQY